MPRYDSDFPFPSSLFNHVCPYQPFSEPFLSALIQLLAAASGFSHEHAAALAAAADTMRTPNFDLDWSSRHTTGWQLLALPNLPVQLGRPETRFPLRPALDLLVSDASWAQRQWNVLLLGRNRLGSLVLFHVGSLTRKKAAAVVGVDKLLLFVGGNAGAAVKVVESWGGLNVGTAGTFAADGAVLALECSLGLRVDPLERDVDAGASRRGKAAVLRRSGAVVAAHGYGMF